MSRNSGYWYAYDIGARNLADLSLKTGISYRTLNKWYHKCITEKRFKELVKEQVKKNKVIYYNSEGDECMNKSEFIMDMAKKYDLNPQTARTIFYKFEGKQDEVEIECRRSQKRQKWRRRLKTLGEKYDVNIPTLHRLMKSKPIDIAYTFNLTEEKFEQLEKVVKRYAERKRK